MRFTRQLLIVLIATVAFATTSAWAEVSIAVVDFQRAINEVKDGASARARLEAMYKEKQAAIAQMEQQLQAMQEEYEKQSMILADEARKAKEQEIMQAQMVYQQTYMASEQEMQQQYGTIMEDLIGKMRDIAAAIGQERGYTIILEATEGGVVYNVDSIDITNELIKRYDSTHGG